MSCSNRNKSGSAQGCQAQHGEAGGRQPFSCRPFSAPAGRAALGSPDPSVGFGWGLWFTVLRGVSVRGERLPSALLHRGLGVTQGLSRGLGSVETGSFCCCEISGVPRVDNDYAPKRCGPGPGWRREEVTCKNHFKVQSLRLGCKYSMLH